MLKYAYAWPGIPPAKMILPRRVSRTKRSFLSRSLPIYPQASSSVSTAIDCKLGDGGMATVYGATHPLIGKKAAIKVMNPALSLDAGLVERFILEARAVNAIGHPEHRRRLQLRPARRRAQLLRHGVAAGRDALRSPVGAAPRRSTRRSTSSTRSATRSRPRTKRASSIATSSRRTCSSDAGARTARSGQAARLRRRQAHRHRRRARRHGPDVAAAADDDRPGRRHARLHLARAGARQVRRRQDRHLRARRHRLRDDPRAAPVRSRQQRRRRAHAPVGRAAGAAHAVAGDSGGARRPAAAHARQDAGQAPVAGGGARGRSSELRGTPPPFDWDSMAPSPGRLVEPSPSQPPGLVAVAAAAARALDARRRPAAVGAARAHALGRGRRCARRWRRGARRRRRAWKPAGTLPAIAQPLSHSTTAASPSRTELPAPATPAVDRRGHPRRPRRRRQRAHRARRRAGGTVGLGRAPARRAPASTRCR